MVKYKLRKQIGNGHFAQVTIDKKVLDGAKYAILDNTANNPHSISEKGYPEFLIAAKSGCKCALDYYLESHNEKFNISIEEIQITHVDTSEHCVFTASFIATLNCLNILDNIELGAEKIAGEKVDRFYVFAKIGNRKFQYVRH